MNLFYFIAWKKVLSIPKSYKEISFVFTFRKRIAFEYFLLKLFHTFFESERNIRQINDTKNLFHFSFIQNVSQKIVIFSVKYVSPKTINLNFCFHLGIERIYFDVRHFTSLLSSLYLYYSITHLCIDDNTSILWAHILLNEL